MTTSPRVSWIPTTTVIPVASLLVAVLLSPATPASAQLSMSLSPVRVEHVIPPGKSWTDVVTVENVSDEPLRAQVTVADWYLERDGIPVFVKRGTWPELSMSEWVEVNPTEFSVPPGGSQVIRYTLSIPEGLPEASYRTAVLVESLPDFEPAAGRNVAYLTARIGVILYNHVGKMAPVAEVVGQEVVSEPGLSQTTAVKLTVRNPGLINVRLSGESQILTLDGQLLRVLSIPDGVVLPQSERELLLRLERPLWHSAFRVVSRLDVGLDELLEVETQVGVVAADGTQQ